MANLGAVDISKLSSRVTMTIALTGLRKFRLRCWFAMVLIRAAACVFPFKVSIDIRGHDA